MSVNSMRTCGTGNHANVHHLVNIADLHDAKISTSAAQPSFPLSCQQAGSISANTRGVHALITSCGLQVAAGCTHPNLWKPHQTFGLPRTCQGCICAHDQRQRRISCCGSDPDAENSEVSALVAVEALAAAPEHVQCQSNIRNV